MLHVIVFGLLALLPEGGAVENNGEVIDEVVVVEERSLALLKRDLREADRRMFDLFNRFNEDREFDIVCENSAPTGSHIKHRSCRPRYVLTLQAEAAMESAEFGAEDTGDESYSDGFEYALAEDLAQERKKELQEKFTEIALREPEFAAAVAERLEAGRRVREASAERSRQKKNR